jgi:hypothetical protein
MRFPRVGRETIVSSPAAEGTQRESVCEASCLLSFSGAVLFIRQVEDFCRESSVSTLMVITSSQIARSLTSENLIKDCMQSRPKLHRSLTPDEGLGQRF